MTLERQKQLLYEICAEYDLDTVLQALIEAHGSGEVLDAAVAATK
ncbi:MAG: hypothetical protein AAGF98_10265 [Cyanobacteria bacterium P01_H01_bin.153]